MAELKGGTTIAGNTALHLGNIPTFNQSTTGNSATATMALKAGAIENYGTVMLANATEMNSIYITAPAYDTNKPTKLLNFDWYTDVWSIGNIRSGGAASEGLGIFLKYIEKAKFTTTGLNVTGTVTATSFIGKSTSSSDSDSLGGKTSSLYQLKLVDLITDGSTIYQISVNDNGRKVNLSYASPVTVTIPTASTGFLAGTQIYFKQLGGQIHFTHADGNTYLHSAGSRYYSKELYSICQLIYEGNNLWTLFGDLIVA